MKRTRRRLWIGIVWSVASVAVLAAVATALFRVAVVAAPEYRDQVAARISTLVGRDVVVGDMNLLWHGLRPTLELRDVVIHRPVDGTAALAARRMRVGFSLLRLARGDVTPVFVDLAGANVAVTLAEDGSVLVQGFAPAAAGTRLDPRKLLPELGRFRSLSLSRIEVLLSVPQLGPQPYPVSVHRAQYQRQQAGAELALDLTLPPELGGRVSGSLNLRGPLTEPGQWRGEFTVHADDVAPQPWLRLWRDTPPVSITAGRVQVQAQFAAGNVDDVELELSADQAMLGSPPSVLRDVKASARWRRQAQGWTLLLDDLRATGGRGAWVSHSGRLEWQPLFSGGVAVAVDADHLRLDDLAPWLALAPEGVIPEWAADLSGDVHGLVLRSRRDETTAQLAYHARLEEAGFGSPAISVRGINGKVSGDENGGRLDLAEAPATVRLPRVFDSVLTLDGLAGNVGWSRRAGGWQVSAPRFQWSGAGTAGEGRLDLELPDGRPADTELSLLATFSADNAVHLKPYMPKFWGQPLRDWLQQAIKSGRVSQGWLSIAGRLSDFPFEDAAGEFSLDLEARGVNLAYAPDWPPVDGVDARLRFRGRGLDISADAGSVSGTRVRNATARIPDFGEPVLAVDGRVSGDAGRYYHFLANSPLRDAFSALIVRTRAQGVADVALQLQIPLRNAAQAEVNGTVALKNVELRHQALGTPFTAVDGVIAFSREQAWSEGLTAMWGEIPLNATLEVVPGQTSRLLTEATLDWSAEHQPAAELVPDWLRPHLAGASTWQVKADLGGEAPALRLESDLQGVELTLPGPLGKPAPQVQSLQLVLTEQAQVLRMDLQYGESLGIDARWDMDGKDLRFRAAHVQLGAVEAGPLPESGFSLDGRVDELDLPRWWALLARQDVVERVAALERVRLQTGLLRLGRFQVPDVTVDLRKDRETWLASLSGESEGEVRWHRERVTARLSRLNLQSEPQSNGMADAAAREPLDPAGLPRAELHIGELLLNGVDLGRLEFETSPVVGGQQIERLVLEDGAVSGRAEGVWRRTQGRSSAEIAFDINTANPAPALAAFGYAPTLEARQSRVWGRLDWPASSHGLRVEEARGRVELQASDGNLRAVEPGAGRVLGLVNFYALPRRLALNFRDVVGRGLSFDRISGSFQLGSGNAVTDDLAIRGPSLRMELRGRVGLTARDYDQRVTVYPDVSGGFTLGAVLLGGPAAGVIALLAQEILDKPLDQVSQLSYHVTGSWDNPQVQRLEAGKRSGQ